MRAVDRRALNSIRLGLPSSSLPSLLFGYWGPPSALIAPCQRRRSRRRIGSIQTRVGLALAVVALGGCSDDSYPILSIRPHAAAPARDAGPATERGADRFDDPVTAVEPAAESATLWARVAGAAELELELTVGGRGEPMRRLAPVDPDADHTARMTVTGLVAGVTYHLTWRARDQSDAEIASGEARFAVPPRAGDERPVTFAFSGDLGGQNVCRDAERGYPILDRLLEAELGFFIGLGDMIYADNPCLSRGAFGNRQVHGRSGPAQSLDEMRRAWRYNRDDPQLARLLSSAGYYAVWDDHEIENNFGPDQRGGLFPVGLRAFREHNPVSGRRLYRSVRWGRNLELFFLDLRSHRSPNRAADDENKTMLGAEQKAWLLAALGASTARHKVVVSSVPIAIPTGGGAAGFDSWVGFETELSEVFARLAASGVERLVFLTTDVHFATAHRFRPVAGAPLEVVEIVVGPMSAGLFPTPALDPTFGPERLFFHAPERPDELDYDEALAYMTAGIVTADELLALEVINALGEVIWKAELGRADVPTSR